MYSKLKILLFFFFFQFFNFIIFNQVYTTEKKGDEQKEEIICEEATGEEYFGELDYKLDIEERAKNDARRKAIEKAYGVYIKSSTIVYNEMLLDDLIEKFVKAKIVSEEVISSDCDKVGSMCYVKMRVCIKETEKEEGSLNVEVYLNKKELAVTLLLPNKVIKNNFCEKGKTYEFPSEEDKKKGIKLRAKLS